MRFLHGFFQRTSVVILCAATAVGWAQKKPRLKPDPVKLDQTMVWLNDSIAKTAGFQLTRAGAQEKLSYQFVANEGCHLSWRPMAAGSDDMQRLYPSVDQDEDLAAIVPGSIQIQPVDEQDLLDGGTGQPAESSANRTTPLYWKLTASYADSSHAEAEPFRFVFTDMQTAQRVAAVLEHGVSLCRGPGTPEKETDVGCDTLPTRTLVNEGHIIANNSGKKPSPILIDPDTQRAMINGRLVNYSDKAVSCVLEVMYYARPRGEWVRNSYVSFDIAPGEAATGSLDLPNYLDAFPRRYNYQCFPKGSVNVHQNSCAELNHPLRLNLKNTTKTSSKP